jgi:hypothetical protein
LPHLCRLLVRFMQPGKLQHCRHGNDVCLHGLLARHVSIQFRADLLQYL